MRLHKCRRGISLVEVLVSVLILGTGLLAGIRCLSGALVTDLKANRVALATAIAQSEIENQRSLGTLQAKSVDAGESLLPGGKVDVTLTDYVINPPVSASQITLKRLAVDVSWNGINAQKEHVIIETLVTNRMKH